MRDDLDLHRTISRAAIASVLLLMSFAAGCRQAKTPEHVDQVLVNGTTTVQDVHIRSELVGGDFWYRAVVPKTSPGERLPVLYLLHGANSGPAELTTQLKIPELAQKERIVIVMPDGRFSYYTNAKHRANARWEDAITTQLIEDVEARLPVLEGLKHRGIAGISMGGYGAIKLALKHPDLYGFAGSMSGAFDITDRPGSLRRWGQTWRIWTTFGVRNNERRDEQIAALLNNAADLQSTTWFVSCGEADPLLAANRSFVNRMRTKNVNLALVSTAGGHDWQSWVAAAPELFMRASAALK